MPHNNRHGFRSTVLEPLSYYSRLAQTIDFLSYLINNPFHHTQINESLMTLKRLIMVFRVIALKEIIATLS